MAMIDKMVGIVREVDKWHFPTDSSSAAQKLLLDVLDSLRETSTLDTASPSVLYNRLFFLHDILHSLERSSIEHISWPLVSYCDGIWKDFFGDDGPQIFYSLTMEHNYMIQRYGRTVESALQNLLPSTKLDALRPKREIYCLQLASAEDENLPMYANIGHEFGHAIYDYHKQKLNPILARELTPVLTTIQETLYAIDVGLANKRCERTVRCLMAVAEELVCDLVGAMLLGPAFFLSLYEMSWGQERGIWQSQLTPNAANIRAYPSFNFRLHCIRETAGVEAFCAELSGLCVKPPFSGWSNLERLCTTISNIETNHVLDHVAIYPRTDPDAMPIQHAITVSLTEIKSALESFLRESKVMLSGMFRNISQPVVAPHVFELLVRLEEHLPPNIVQDGTLLGVPATFPSILSCSAVARTMAMYEATPDKQKELARKLDMIDRLTEKALEVSLIQTQYTRKMVKA